MASTTATERRDALVERLFAATIGAFDLCSVYVGDRLGLYRALAEADPMTPAQLAAAAGIHERYALEWLEQQAASGIVDVSGDEPGGSRRFYLPDGHAEALLDEDSLNYVAPFGKFLLLGCLRPVDALLEAYRTGDGVPYGDYGVDLHEGQAAFTRPMFVNLLAQEWLPAVSGVHERLVADPPGPRRRSRVWRRYLEHRDREGLSEGARRRDRPRRSVDRSCKPQPDGEWSRGPRELPRAGRRRRVAPGRV